MAKLWRPVKEWVPNEWVTMREAWLRVYASLSEDMAGTRRDVKADLLAGDLVGAARVVTPDKTERCIIFEPEFWEPVELAYSWSVNGWEEHYHEGEKWRFFVRRRELDKRYPAAANATPSEPPADPLRPPPRRPGPPPDTERWWGICAEIARRCIDEKTGRVAVPRSENKLAEHVLKHLAEIGEGQPSPSEMRAAVKYICAALRKVQR